MAYKIFKRGGYFYIVDTTDGRERDGLTSGVRVTRGTTAQDTFYISGVANWSNSTPLNILEIQDFNGDSYTVDSFIRFYESASSTDVVIQDSTQPTVIIRATELIAETTLTVDAVDDAYEFTIASTTGADIGQTMTVYSVDKNRVTFFYVKDINGNVITVDSPIDFEYVIGDYVQFGNRNLAVDGSVTPRIFGVRNPTATDIDFKVDFTRMIFSMQTTSRGDYDEFGNVPVLDKGLLCRFVDGRKQNIFNVKNNRELDNLMFDFKFIAATGNSPDGLSGRFSFDKLGVVIRLRPFEDLQFVVQDNLSALTRFEILLEGGGVVD